MNWAREIYTHYREVKDVVDTCGIILYTDAHANIKKVLADNTYWNSLDEISGKKWAILSIKPKAGAYEIPRTNHSSDTFGFMVRVWKEPKENQELLEEFEIESTKELPLLLCFAQYKDGEILKASVKLDDSSIDEAFKSLRRTIRAIAEAVEDIQIENSKNPLGVHGAVSHAIDNYKNWEFMKKGIKFIPWVSKFITAFDD